MIAHHVEARSAELDAEESRLRDELRFVEDRIHTRLRGDTHGNADAIAELEKRVRVIVLELCAIERERIELSVAASL